MKKDQRRKTAQGYAELTSPQLIDDVWQALNFDLANGIQSLYDSNVAESGSGYVYRDAKLVGSATHNRFIYWRTSNEVLELVEMSTEAMLEANQIRLTFTNSPIIGPLTVLEFSDSVIFIITTVTSVHRIELPHPKTVTRSIFSEFTSDVLFNPANYHIFNNPDILTNQVPICSTAWHYDNKIKCSLAFPDSSLLIVEFGRHAVTTYDIKQVGIIGRLWSRMPQLLTKSPNDCDNAVFICCPYINREIQDALLIALCRDFKIRIFSTKHRECVSTVNINRTNDLSQSYPGPSNSEPPMMKMFGESIIIYLSECEPEFVLFKYSYEDDHHTVNHIETIQAPIWEKLIDFSVTSERIWALATIRETESTLCYIDVKSSLERSNDADESIEDSWNYVDSNDIMSLPRAKNLVADIFWRNNFSKSTIRKALVGITGPCAIRENTIEELESISFKRIVDENQAEAWTRFYNYCMQNHDAANKNLGLIASHDETLISIVKRSSPSFICPVASFIDEGICRGIEYSSCIKGLLKPLRYIANDLMNDKLTNMFEEKLYEDPSRVTEMIETIVDTISSSERFKSSKFNFTNHQSILTGINFICDQLDLTQESEELIDMLRKKGKKMRPKGQPLGSNSGIIITFELFRNIVRARMILARDLLIYIHIIGQLGESGDLNGQNTNLMQDLYSSSTLKRLLDSLRCYYILTWVAETPIKIVSGDKEQTTKDLITFVSTRFEFFNNAGELIEYPSTSSLDMIISQNLLMNFLSKCNLNSHLCAVPDMVNESTVSNSQYVMENVIRTCKMLWPMSSAHCLPEFLFTYQVDLHLEKYLDLTEHWFENRDDDRQFFRAINCLAQKRALQSVEIFNTLLMRATPDNLIGRCTGMEQGKLDPQEDIDPSQICRFYEWLIQLYEVQNHLECLVTIINQCISLISRSSDPDQQHSVNCFNAKLFQYYLEMDDNDAAYHTMVLTEDHSLRFNCLRKFVVYHCEKKQWSDLINYPFIDIKEDFTDILKQRAESSDLSVLNENDLYKTSYYDLLFSHYVVDEEYGRASEVMYNYAQRLAYEQPGIVSIRKQVDCLLIALNTLRCVNDTEAAIDTGSLQRREEGRTSIHKRAHDGENSASFVRRCGNHESANSPNVTCHTIKLKYELTKARLKLLEKDNSGNAIALAPLTPDETIAQLVASSMFSSAMDLALLFRTSMDIVMEGLTSKYLSIVRLSAIDLVVNQEIERDLSEIFNDSYSIIQTYNYIANSTCPPATKIWRLIEFYLNCYDGVAHRHALENSSKGSCTVLMRVVAEKLLSAGYDVPASLRRMYMSRNTPELLKLMIKYDKLEDAAELAVEMIDRIVEPATWVAVNNPFSNELHQFYLPTHLIILLADYLNEDATDISRVKAAEILLDKLNQFRRFVRN